MKFALIEQRDPSGPPRVHELFEDDPGLHGALEVVQVPDGVVVGWMRRADGSFAPYEPPLDDAKAERARTLRFDCLHAITGGFASSALGGPHRYGSSDTDRENIDRAAMAALAGQKDPAWRAQIQCAAEGEDRALVAHTAAQVHQVSSDLHAHIEGARVRLADLKGKVEAASSVAAVQAITWA